jgi:hypothetical protein
VDILTLELERAFGQVGATALADVSGTMLTERRDP